MELKITEHAKQRYAERIMDKNEKYDIVSFIANNNAKITNDITKLVEYGQLLYQGTPNYEFQKQPVRIYLKDTWVIVLDNRADKVITLYSIDLGVGREFNDEYIGKLIERLDNAKKEYEEENTVIQERKSEFNNLIAENEKIINEYRKTVKSLEEQNKMYKDMIQSLDTNRALAEKEVRSVVATLIGKKVF